MTKRITVSSASSPASASAETRRSARRIVARATSSAADSRVPPGITNFGGSSTCAMYLSISPSSSVTIASVTRLTPSSRRSAASGAVASSAPATNRASWRPRMSPASSSSPGPQRARAAPSAEVASSSEPYASVRLSDFGTRPPYQSEVVPSSPLRV